MDILIVDIKGKFAHFRKFYTNSSSLSYSVPPRTTIAGMLAGILGYDRDSYYEIFSKEQLNIAIRKLTPTRKIMQSLNYIKADNPGKILNPKEHTQIPFEIITSDKGRVSYRIYINHRDKNIMDELQKRILDKKYYYSPYLGAAPFNCTFEFVDRVQGTLMEEKDEVLIYSLINKESINKCFVTLEDKELFLVKEKMPSEILKNRVIEKVDNYIYDENTNSLKVNLNCNYIKLKYKFIEENILFM